MASLKGSSAWLPRPKYKEREVNMSEVWNSEYSLHLHSDLTSLRRTQQYQYYRRVFHRKLSPEATWAAWFAERWCCIPMLAIPIWYCSNIVPFPFYQQNSQCRALTNFMLVYASWRTGAICSTSEVVLIPLKKNWALKTLCPSWDSKKHCHPFTFFFLCMALCTSWAHGGSPRTNPYLGLGLWRVTQPLLGSHYFSEVTHQLRFPCTMFHTTSSVTHSSKKWARPAKIHHLSCTNSPCSLFTGAWDQAFSQGSALLHSITRDDTAQRTWNTEQASLAQQCTPAALLSTHPHQQHGPCQNTG